MILSAVTGGSGVAATSETHDIPRLDAVTIDGDAGDWGERGFEVRVLHDERPPRKPVTEFDARLRLGWDSRGLVGLVDVTDRAVFESEADSDLWQRDCVEVFMATGPGELDIYQLVLSPGIRPARDAARLCLMDYRQTPELRRDRALSAQVARRLTPDGYVLEFLLPWSNLALTPREGLTLALQVHVTNVDRDEDAIWGRRTLYFNPAGGGCLWDTMKMTALRLAEHPSPPITTVARAYHQSFRRVKVDVASRDDLGGREVSAVAQGVELGRGTMCSDRQLATVSLTLPMPAPQATYDPLEVRLGERVIAQTGLPLLAADRRDALERAVLLCRPAVFAGKRLPKPEFEQPAMVEDIIGPYELSATYYNAAMEPVNEAATPGRYGAVVEVRPESGPLSRRFVTLYRQPEAAKWNEVDWPVKIPPEVGLDPQVAAEHAPLLAATARSQFQQALGSDPSWAVLLSGLHETPPGTRFVKRTSPSAVDARWWYELRQKVGGLEPLRYHVYVPHADAAQPTKRWPTFIYLHGSSTPWEKAGRTELIARARALPEFPFVVIAPNCPITRRWEPLPLKALVEEVIATLPVDADRIYLTGTSMGGYGTWTMANEFPELFAAAIPLCGGGDPQDVLRMKDLPIWVFHGKQDTVVPIARSREMVDALREVGSAVRFTELECGHDPGRLVFGDPQLYEWLQQQVRRPIPPSNRSTEVP